MTNPWARRFAAILFAAVAVPVTVAQPLSPALRARLEATTSGRWRDAPAGEALTRVSQGLAPLWIDRRVDRRRELDHEARDVSVATLLDGVAGGLGLAAAPLDAVVYVGPPEAASALPTLAAAWRRGAPPGMRRRTELHWPRLAQPRDIAARVAEEGGLRLANPEAIPHDLWPEGGAPLMAVGDQLLLVALGFGLRWDLAGEGVARLRPIEPVDDATALPLVTRLGGRPEAVRPVAPLAEERFTLRVVDAPLGGLLAELARQRGLELEASLPEATLATRVSLAVRDATLEELLRAVGVASGLRLEAEGGRLVARLPEAERAGAP